MLWNNTNQWNKYNIYVSANRLTELSLVLIKDKGFRMKILAYVMKTLGEKQSSNSGLRKVPRNLLINYHMLLAVTACNCQS